MTENSSLVDRVLDRLREQRQDWIATYRRQVSVKLPFEAASADAAYLADLGISHVYASPIFKARPGSEHGYDVCDHSQINPELGSTEDFDAYCEELHQHGLGLIIDLVPNHMAATPENPWWNDVLENGPNSPYAGYFDIDWHPVKDELANKVMLPKLGDPYGAVLERGELQIEFDEGAFYVRYFETRFPLGPKSILPLLLFRLDKIEAELGADSPALLEYQSILTSLEYLPAQTDISLRDTIERQREKEVIKRRLRDLSAASPEVAAHIASNLSSFNGEPGNPASFDRLDAILNAQAYRLANWRAASDEINYRRFFDVNDLAALSMEQPAVFHAAHALVGRLLALGQVNGLRIDHIDGLFSPKEYLERLQWLYLAETARLLCEADGPDALANWPAIASETLRECCRRLELRSPSRADLVAILGASVGTEYRDESPTTESRSAEYPLYVVVEKILGPDEPLPDDWPTEGTSGYDFLNALNGAFIDARGLADLRRQFARVTGDRREFELTAEDGKSLVLRVAMASELQMLAHRLNRISEQHRRTRDLTLNSLRFALREILICFPVYRTYPRPGGVSDRDRRVIHRAIRQARRRNPAVDPHVFDFIQQVLLLQHPAGLSEAEIRDREFFAGRFQQVTSPVMAKGVEDTAFYVYLPLASANEVGSYPSDAAFSVADFHDENMTRRQRMPRAMSCTSTHDTKRSEDVRARINVLTEVPRLWRDAVSRWLAKNRKLRRKIDEGVSPSRTDEWLLYQTLIGTWPLESLDGPLPDDYVERLIAYCTKAARESKQQTSWIHPHADYEDGLQQFVRSLLDPGVSAGFLADIRQILKTIIRPGLATAAAQVVLKTLSPGVPDFYQGQELWDFSLVDPDNRRRVDMTHRARLLDETRNQYAAAPAEFVERLFQEPASPELKLFMTFRSLEIRREYADLLQTGRYQPLAVAGPAADHVIAFVWLPTDRTASPDDVLVVVAGRLWLKLWQTRGDAAESGQWPPRGVWHETSLVVDGLPTARPLVNLLTRESLEGSGQTLPVELLLGNCPVAVLGNAHAD
ncbi:MAG: malto-oligosyltrehalose synthase [Planctomycetaceae bacterium]|nr:malto-oligosyltrehalose synthase [Planctomycetaceae bacterium]